MGWVEVSGTITGSYAAGMGVSDPGKFFNGTVTASQFNGSGAGLTNIGTASIASGSISTPLLADGAVTQAKLALTSLNVTGPVTATIFNGSGAGLTNIGAASIIPEQLPPNRRTLQGSPSASAVHHA